MAILYGPFLMATSVCTYLLNFIFRNRKIDDWMVSFWGRISCRMFGVRVHVVGLEHLHEVGGAVLVFNHASFFDIFALADGIPGLRFGAKIELFKIPFFGAAMMRLGMLPIDRARKESVFRIYDEATIRMQNGERFALAPEGGRTKQQPEGGRTKPQPGRLTSRQFSGGEARQSPAGDTDRKSREILAPFKSGPFVFAIQAQVPIVPVVIRGASQILPKGQLFPNWDRWFRDVEVRILPPLSTQNYDLKNRPDLQQQVYCEMQSQLN
jgi:1-acyl-sn-glycerol-3-phosphate acyltransferase